MSDVFPGPEQGEYQAGRCWFSRQGRLFRVGVTQAGIEQLGEVERLFFSLERTLVEPGDVVATVAGSEGEMEVVSLVSGTVTRVNRKAEQMPEAVSEDPLDEGWLFEVEAAEEDVRWALRLSEFDDVGA